MSCCERGTGSRDGSRENMWAGTGRWSLLLDEEREVIYLRETLITPEAYLKRMFAAGVDQARGVPYQWDDGWAGYAERFASREGQFIAANSLAALGQRGAGI